MRTMWTTCSSSTSSSRRRQHARLLLHVGDASPLERRVLEEWHLFARQWHVIIGTLLVLIYLVLMVFLNLSYYRYRAPLDGRRLRDLGHEIVPKLSHAHYAIVDIPLYSLLLIVFVVLLGTIRPCFAGPNSKRTPYLVNIVRRFLVAYAIGHVLRALSYLPTTIPGGMDKCMVEEELERARPTLAECFYRTASVETNCGDEMFSGHMLLCCLIVCLVHQYAAACHGPLLARALLWTSVVLAFAEAMTILAARHHYTSDIVVAVYVTPLMWSQLLQWIPDLEPDGETVDQMIEEGHGGCLHRAASRISPPGSPTAAGSPVSLTSARPGAVMASGGATPLASHAFFSDSHRTPLLSAPAVGSSRPEEDVDEEVGTLTLVA